jgi:hypothetical protein
MDLLMTPPRRIAAALGLATVAAAGGAFAEAPAGASKTQWSMFEDARALAGADPESRQRTLDEIQALGADTLRIGVGWDQVAPDPQARQKPDFDAADPSAYPGFGRYDDLVQRATRMGFRIMITLAPPAPRWATRGGRGDNYRLDSSKFADFAGATARRYSGEFNGLPAVYYFSIWNEPGHQLFLKPRPLAPRIYRRMVERAMPAIRRAAPAAKVFVGELAPVGTDTKVIGPLTFLRKWLCLDASYKRLRGQKARAAGCRNFEKVDADGFAHHPYGVQERSTRPRKGRDIVNISVIRRLGKALDRAARAGRISARMPIYNTEFGSQSSPPDPFVGISLASQARLINHGEEISHRYPRLKSYSQYLLYDDEPREGSAAVKWSGFQTGLRFDDGRKKPSYDAYRCAIVVRKRRSGVRIWGHVRPGVGPRRVQLQRRVSGRFVDAGGVIETNSRGYFNVTGKRSGIYRYICYTVDLATGERSMIGTSRAASPNP